MKNRGKPMVLLCVIAAMIIVALVVVAVSVINDNNKDKYTAIGTFVSAGVALVALMFFVAQTSKVIDAFDVQSRTFDVENRPYLQATLNPLSPNPNMLQLSLRKEAQQFHAGGHLSFKNSGKIPATIVDAEYKVVSDQAPNQDIMKYFEERGGFPHIKLISPGDSNSSVFLNPQVGSKPRLVQVWAKITYMGVDAKKHYWYLFNYLYGISYEKDKPIRAQLMSPLEDWDRNTGAQEPQYSAPDWKKYLATLDERK